MKYLIGKRLFQFRDLKIGDIFYVKGINKFFIRTSDMYNDGEPLCNAICLSNGEDYWFDDLDEVCLYTKPLDLEYDCSDDFVEWKDYKKIMLDK